MILVVICLPDNAVDSGALTGGTRWSDHSHHELHSTCVLVSVYSETFASCLGRPSPPTCDWLHFWHCLLRVCSESCSLFLCCSCKQVKSLTLSLFADSFLLCLQIIHIYRHFSSGQGLCKNREELVYIFYCNPDSCDHGALR